MTARFYCIIFRREPSNRPSGAKFGGEANRGCACRRFRVSVLKTLHAALYRENTQLN
jgi:hypothetical protein